jgi:hypothetical protein
MKMSDGSKNKLDSLKVVGNSSLKNSLKCAKENVHFSESMNPFLYLRTVSIMKTEVLLRVCVVCN